MSVESTLKTMLACGENHDPQCLAEDAVIVHMSTGEETKGREAVGQMLHYIYHVAFNARGERTNTTISDGQAVLECYLRERK